jgi:hypothetical protein
MGRQRFLLEGLLWPWRRHDGLFCHAAKYGRGAGYPWKFGDPVNNSGMFKRCEAALGMNAGVDLSCAKNVRIGDPVPGVCGGGQQRDAGLCYPNCKTGYGGAGRAMAIIRKQAKEAGKELSQATVETYAEAVGPGREASARGTRASATLPPPRDRWDEQGSSL